MRIFQGSLVSFCGRSHFLPRALHYLSPFPLFTTEVFASKADFPVFCHFTQFPNSAKKWKKNKLRCRKKDRNEATMRCNWRGFPLYFHHRPPDLNSFLNPSMFHLKPQIQFHNYSALETETGVGIFKITLSIKVNVKLSIQSRIQK